MASHSPRAAVVLLSLLVLASSCLAGELFGIGSKRGQQGRQGSACQLDRINSLEPSNSIKCDAGTIDVWDHNEDEFQCAGVAVVRQVIDPNGLLLPSFTNAPQLIYIVQGRGIQGLVLPGCPETYQQSQFASSGWQSEEEFRPRGGQSEEEFGSRGGQSSRRFHQDQHQKVRRFEEGDVLVLPQGAAHWIYNDGNRPLVAVVLLDTTSSLNQLDVSPRRSYLAGNPEDEHQTEGRERLSRHESQGKHGSRSCNNIFCGFDAEFLAEAFNVDIETARKLQSHNDNRNNIVKVEGRLQVLRPPRRESERYRHSSKGESKWWMPRETDSNGFEETLCNMRLRENIGDPSRADVYTSQAGRINTLNSHTLPILSWLQLSAEHGILQTDALMVPHWNMDAHSVIYAIRGRARIQVVDNNGRAVFDEELQKGRVLVVPQNYAVVKRAENEEFEWISFKTNDNAMISQLAGRNSVIRAFPDEVVANSYRISVEDARRLKYSRKETTVFRTPSISRRTRKAVA